MKRTLFLAISLIACLSAMAQTPPSLHIEGRNVVDSHGNVVVMHGVMDTPSEWFNSGRWGWDSYDDAGTPAKCVAYFEKLFTAITDTTQGAWCTLFRLHLDPCWTNNNSVTASGFTKDGNDWYDPNGLKVDGEANIVHFDKSRLNRFMTSVYVPIIKKALAHGLHVIIRPPGVFPGNVKVGDYYNEYLMTVWDLVSKNTTIKQYSGQISIELGNEPVGLKDANGNDNATAMHDFFQPIVDKIRANGFTGIIWVPGKVWQQDYKDYETHPITGYNIGYAVHCYTGWYGQSDESADGDAFIRNFVNSVPVVRTNPIAITEIDWSPSTPDLDNDGNYQYNPDGSLKTKNYGTWATGSTSKWGLAYKKMKDYYGNISMTLTSTDDLIDMDYYLNTGEVRPAFTEKMTANGVDPMEACGKACMDWYAEYAKENFARPDYKNLSTNLNSTQKNFINPVIAADFPDPDVARLGDTYYMLSTTMHLLPGATLLKSKDLVNWEYCCNPLEQFSAEDKYSLIDGKNGYAGGMWAGAIEEHDGKLYILINANDAGGFVLSTDDPEGKWEVKKLSRSYYDPGMIFEGDRIYIACGIGNINICELDQDWNFIRETTVIRDKQGLEGSHLYHIGDYYYIYATYGGWPSGQAIFRASDITGTYEEKMLVEKTINGSPNTVHQGALIEIPQTGEWWTMLMEDKGAIGRLPSLHPVKWADGWPTVGTNGVPKLTYTRPDVGTTYPVTILPTNDNFRHYELGKQWQWNHNPAGGLWSLLERPGYLRLHTVSVTDNMMQARNTLTQRIVAFHKATSPYGLDTSKPSVGTIALDISHMQAGDMAGLAVQQDPYAMLAVTKDEEGQYSLVWQSGSHTNLSDFTPQSQTESITPEGDVIYLRATFNCGTSEAAFLYSFDNKTWQAIGGTTTLRYNLSVFVGARWAIFNYATQETGGYVDLDWFSTEDDFEESMFAPSDFEGYSTEMLTMTSLDMASNAQDMEVMVGSARDIELIATFADGHTENVAQAARYTCDWPDLLDINAGRIKGKGEGQCAVSASYTDPLGNEREVNFNVTSTFFPFATEFISYIWDSGTYDEQNRIFCPNMYGQMGWQYSGGADFSGYKYLVVKLDKAASSSSADIRLYAQSSIWGGSCYIRSFGSSKRIVIPLKSIKYTDGDKKGQAVDLTAIYIVAIWTNGNAAGVDFDDIYLTNNSDYSRETNTAIDDIDTDTDCMGDGVIYDLAGRRVSKPTHGVYITNGKKFIKR